MKKLLLLLLATSFSFAQVSVGSRHVGLSKDIKKNTWSDFKKTTTVFILSDLYEKSIYEGILSKSWSVTPYKVVSKESFDILDYVKGDYSFANLNAFAKQKTKNLTKVSNNFYAYITFSVPDLKKLRKNINKILSKHYSKEEENQKLRKVLSTKRQSVALFHLHLKSEIIRKLLGLKYHSKADNTKITSPLFNDDVYENYSPGYLKNYFQKINQLITKEENYWLYEDDSAIELGQLASKTLYVPDYLNKSYNPFSYNDKMKSNKIEKLFEKYKYNYKVIPTSELSKKIMNNEDVYYIRYVRTNAERFIQIVSSKTGEIVYRDYASGVNMTWNITSKKINKVGKEVTKMKKKLDKAAKK